MCYQNCQRLLLGAQDTELAARLEYHEGLVVCGVGFIIEHAWLVLDGGVQDPTLNKADTVRAYLASINYSVDRVKHAVFTHRIWGPIDAEALSQLRP